MSIATVLMRAIVLVGCAMAVEARAQSLGNGFVYLEDIDPSIIQDMRYASSDNFTGQPLPGYRSARCVIKAAVAAALKKVQADLAADHLSLKMFDCYRPVRAVQAMVRWVGDSRVEGDKTYFPRTQKSLLIQQGYIAARSGHSTGTAIDLGLVDVSAPQEADTVVRGRSACTADDHFRAPHEVDMGTSFDCFDAKSATRSSGLTLLQQQHRATLVAAMARHGFANYSREWWHFSFSSGSSGAFDFDIPVALKP